MISLEFHWDRALTVGISYQYTFVGQTRRKFMQNLILKYLFNPLYVNDNE